MMGCIRTYIISVISAVLLSAIVRVLFGSEKHSSIRFVSGLLVLLTVIAPITRLDFDEIARSISRMKLDETTILTKPLQENSELISQLIKEKCEAYIWDKAIAAGASPAEISVNVQNGDPPYPVAVLISGQFTQQQKSLLSMQIERDLAIPQAEQEWKWKSTAKK